MIRLILLAFMKNSAPTTAKHPLGYLMIMHYHLHVKLWFHTMRPFVLPGWNCDD